MPFCHFSKIFTGTTLADLKTNNELQTAQNCRRIEYIELVSINIEQPEFDLLCRDISKPQCCYQKYVFDSRADSSGRWNCIVIKCKPNKQKIILYTAGHTYPLYAAIDE